MKVKKSALACAIFTATLAGNAMASMITFDDLSTSYYSTINNGYHGLNWSNFGVLNTSSSSVLTSGYTKGVISPSNVGFNLNGTSASFSSANAFIFNSAYFTAAWNNGLNISIQGYLNNNLIDYSNFTVTTNGPTFEALHWNVDKVVISSSGGTSAGYGGTGTQFVMDNLNVSTVPVPAAAWLFGSGLIGLVGLAKRKKA